MIKRETAVRLGVSFTADDKKLLNRLDKRFGGIGTTAIIRMALRVLDSAHNPTRAA